MTERHGLIGAILGVGLLLATGVQAQTTERVSVASDGTQENGDSNGAAISADGRFVAFNSEASNLVSSDTNFEFDVFVHDRVTGVTERVSVAGDASEGDDFSLGPAISADGRFVAFTSIASNLVAGDTNDEADVFVHDRDTDTTERVSVASDGTQGNDLSLDAAISGDGRFVAFISLASNLVAGDTNNEADIFVHDRDNDTTERVSVASDASQGNNFSLGPAISANGRFVAFETRSSNLIFGDTCCSDVFVHDRDTGITERVSVTSNGTQGNGDSNDPVISADGRFVAFESIASNLVADDTNFGFDVFVHDRDTGTTERVSVDSIGGQGNGVSYDPVISADGRFVAFESSSSNLVSGDTNGYEDVFVHDRDTGVTERVSVASDGSQGNHESDVPAISGDGRFVAFQSGSSNLIFGDTCCSDIFVHDREFDGGPPQLAIVGSCPGTISISVTDAAPNGRVAFAASTGAGPFSLPPGPCAGAEVGLVDPNLLGVLVADNSAAIAHDEDVGVDACGIFVQVLDLTTCQPSNVASVP